MEWLDAESFLDEAISREKRGGVKSERFLKAQSDKRAYLEHRDRLEAMGFTGDVPLILGTDNYSHREHAASVWLKKNNLLISNEAKDEESELYEIPEKR